MKRHKTARTMRISIEVLHKILHTIGSLPAELGGVLGSSDGGATITHYFYDECAETDAGVYYPNVDVINNYVIPDWSKKNVDIVGFVHSHPYGHDHPSPGDVAYAKRLMPGLQATSLAMPIVQSGADGIYQIKGYYIDQSANGHAAVEPAAIVTAEAGSEPEHFHSRVEQVYPLAVMRRKTVVIIGCGGAAEYTEHLARCGVGRLVLIDGDAYSPTNLATQQCYRDEIGLNKATALARRVSRIDPGTEVMGLPDFLDEDMSDADFMELVGPELLECPKDVLIAACTDDFYAQARVARLALKYGTPFLAAQLYEGGQGGEVIFTYPGVTPSCPRCLLTGRYDAYLNQGYRNDVGSHQTPIFATQRINSLKGFVSLMLLLYGEAPGSPFHDMLARVAGRNYLQVRMSQDSLLNPLFDKHFGASPYSFFDETLWLTQTPEPRCPDCGGCGDLRLVAGAIQDSRCLPKGGAVALEH